MVDEKPPHITLEYAAPEPNARRWYDSLLDWTGGFLVVASSIMLLCGLVYWIGQLWSGFHHGN
jgi:hypothetical protein